jgi:hypothetical protein
MSGLKHAGIRLHLRPWISAFSGIVRLDALAADFGDLGLFSLGPRANSEMIWMKRSPPATE